MTDLRSSDAVKSNGVQNMFPEGYVKVVLVAGMNNPPALHLAGPHANGRLPLAIDREKARHGFWPDRVIGLDRATVIEQHFVQNEHALNGASDLRDIIEVTLDDHRAGHAAGDLDIGTAVVMRVIPIGAPRMIARDGDFDFVALPRLHRSEYIVGDPLRI